MGRRAYNRGWLAAALAVEAPYPAHIFRPLTDEEVDEVVKVMNATVPNASERMHASWARHLADVLRWELKIRNTVQW